MESPPKRITRSRAAAKAEEPAKTRIITAAARARSTATAGTKSTAAKRKVRSDENEDEEEQREVPAVRRGRGRPKKTEEHEPAAQAEAPAKPTRGRPAKKAATESSKEEPRSAAASAAAAPTKPTRGRPRKVVAEAPAETPAPEPVKRTRGRPATTTRTAAAAAAKPAVKKSVTFQEPGKENVEPGTKEPGAKEPAKTGLRGRPARRGAAAVAATAPRSTRATVSTTASTEKKPLSPKKVTQMPVSRIVDESEDELSGEMTVIKPMMKGARRPPTSKETPALKVEDEEEKEDEVGEAAEDDDGPTGTLNAPDLGPSMTVSPAKRMPASPFKDSMKSPARRIGAVPLPGSNTNPTGSSSLEQSNASTLKTSLMQSPAKRPQSPIKGLNLMPSLPAQGSQSAMKASLLQSPAKRAIPGMKPLTEPRQRDAMPLTGSPSIKPLVMSTPTPANLGRPSAKLMMEDQPDESPEEVDDDPFSQPIENLQFPGRLSAVLPRHADPVLRKDMGLDDMPMEVQVSEQGPEVDIENIVGDPVDVMELPVEEAIENGLEEAAEPMVDVEEPAPEEEIIVEVEEVAEVSEDDAIVSSPQSPTSPENPVFQLRQKDLDPCHDMDSESEDEMEAAVYRTSATPATKTPRTAKSQAKTSRVSMGGFSALAERFGSWAAASPIKMAPLSSSDNSEMAQPLKASEQLVTPQTESPLMAENFFENEMLVRPEAEAEVSEVAEGEVQEPAFDEDLMVTDEDVALAEEANEMSLMDPEQPEEASVNHDTSFDDTISEASQEYGDENQVPVDPAMMVAHSPGPVTPVRPVMKTFATTTKVPLKAADESTPSPIKKRSFSASRVAPKRPSGPSKNATVMTLSPAKERKSLPGARPPTTPGPVTPSKSDLWSSMGTPARTPRRDLNPALLGGAVVYVDVHTSEGADASGIFVELLTQMGAKCVDAWDWDPSSDGSSSRKIGITHVVFKDGSKRTLEKVRQAKGVVQCVGVTWVLDCERENEWLEESPFGINISSQVSRGGARRRQSMEPTALTSVNGSPAGSPSKSSGPPQTPLRRRESTAWMFTPSEQGDEDEDDPEWSNAMLTPVPKTPAPEAIARYAANIVPETPSAAYEDEDEDDEDESPTKQTMITRTCPPKKAYREFDQGLLRQNKDEQVLMRLMAARRKSLQFAPKIGSPLARAWK